MTLDDLRFTSAFSSPKWQREAALRLLKLLAFYSLLSLGGALLLHLARWVIAWTTGVTGVTFMLCLIGGGTSVLLLYRWLILARKPALSLERHLDSPGKLKSLPASDLTEPPLAGTPSSSSDSKHLVSTVKLEPLPARDSAEPLLTGTPTPSSDRKHLDLQGKLEPPHAGYLTETQREVLKLITEYTREHGIAPTHREICQKLGFSSYGTVYKHLKLLQQKGFLRRDWNQKRGIELIRSIPGGEGRHLPFFGRIAAGRPLESLSGNDRVLVPGHLLSESGGDHYVLRVVGESMIDEGICDGDFVVVLRRDWADQGDIAVVLVGGDATLKRFYSEGDLVLLQPANPTMQTIRLPAKDVRIQGVVVGLIRKY